MIMLRMVINTSKIFFFYNEFKFFHFSSAKILILKKQSIYQLFQSFPYKSIRIKRLTTMRSIIFP